jgi:hypothetical protein
MTMPATTPTFLTRARGTVAGFDGDLAAIVAHFQRLLIAGAIDQLRGDAEMLIFLEPNLFQECALRLPALRSALTIR